MILFVLLLSANTSFHPQTPILCRQYYPGTNQIVPEGIPFNYTPQQKVLNNLKCYCEVVKPLETLCIDNGYDRADCLAKTANWATLNLIDGLSIVRSVIRVPARRNVIVNIQPTP